jgi:hypothetical protein
MELCQLIQCVNGYGWLHIETVASYLCRGRSMAGSVVLNCKGRERPSDGLATRVTSPSRGPTHLSCETDRTKLSASSRLYSAYWWGDSSIINSQRSGTKRSKRNRVTFLEFICKDWGNSRKTSNKTVNIPVEIRTEKLWNMLENLPLR